MRLIFNTQLSITISDTGKIIEVNILVEVLGYSRYKIYKVSFLKTRTVLMSLLIQAVDKCRNCMSQQPVLMRKSAKNVII